MKKKNSIVIGLVIVVILAVGGYMIFHKSPKAITTTTSSTKNTVPAVNNAVLKTKTNLTLGEYLTNPGNKALYTYGGDTAGVSNCTGSCLATWPAYQDTGSTTNLPKGVSTIKRTDNGQIQYTYNGMPLYFFIGDSVGQVTGNGVSNFHVATPAAAIAPSQPATTSTQTQSTTSTTQPSSTSSSW
jgi:predicted lipoprotein with Yx(FWY)xxD motif